MIEYVKPCPFCGSNVDISLQENRIFNTVSYGVVCFCCGIGTRPNFYKTATDAIKAWNRRANVD